MDLIRFIQRIQVQGGEKAFIMKRIHLILYKMLDLLAIKTIIIRGIQYS